MSLQQSPRPEAGSVPCISCECYYDLCLPEDQRMWCSRLNKCVMVQALILVVVLVHFTANAQVASYNLENQRQSSSSSSNNLCNNPACQCQDSPDGHRIFCHCSHFSPHVTKNFTLFTPPIIQPGTFLLHISDCDWVDIVKSPIQTIDQNIPTWFAVNNIIQLNLHLDAVLFGKNVLLQNITLLPKLPSGILHLASVSSDEASPVMESFHMDNSHVQVVRYHAFDSVLLNKSFSIHNVTFESIEEHAFNVSVSNGNITMSNSRIKHAYPSTFLLKAQQMMFHECDFGVIESNAITVKADAFYVQSNTFYEDIMTHAFDVRAKSVIMLYNKFITLHEQAFFRIQDDLNSPSSYVFQHNFLHLTGNGSFNPNRNMGMYVKITDNVFNNCSSSNIGWIWEAVYGPYVLDRTRDFYSILIKSENNNLCYSHDGSCYLENITSLYNPRDPKNAIDRFKNPNATNEEICQYLENNSSNLLEPTVILFVQMVCFYLFAFLMQL